MTNDIESRPLLVVPEVELPEEKIIFGCSPAMEKVRQKIERVIFADVPLLLRGESGAGKELIARHIHRRQFGPSASFVRLNVVKAQNTTLEEIFANTREELNSRPAVPHHDEYRNGWPCTLFLDEVADLNREWQFKLKQFLQLNSLKPLREGKDQFSGVRLICASDRPL